MAEKNGILRSTLHRATKSGFACRGLYVARMSCLLLVARGRVVIWVLAHELRATLMSTMFSSLLLFPRAFPNWSYESSWTIFITRMFLSCVALIFNCWGNILSGTQTGLIQHQMLSHVLWCEFFESDCISTSFTDAFTSSCRVFLCIFVPLSQIDARVC